MTLDVLAAEAASQEEELAAIKDLGPSEILLRYQARLLETVSQNALTVAEKSRRIGYTWGMAAHAVLVAAAQRSAGGMDVFYIAYEKEMTREFIDTCGMWAKHFGMVASDVQEMMWKDDKEDEGILAFRIIFASGYEIVALSSSPRGLRGRQGLVIIDEAAFHDDLDELLKAALALLMWGGRVVVISTHNGVSNPFNRLIEDIRADRRKGTIIRVTLDDALADGLFKRICQRSSKPWSPEAEASWRQDVIDTYGDAADEELFCIPRASGGQWLPRPLIEARMEAEIPVVRWSCPPEFVDLPDIARGIAVAAWLVAEVRPLLLALPRHQQHFFGMDFGRTGDLSVMWPMSLMPDLVRRTPFTIELRNVPFKEQETIMFYVLDRLPHFMKSAHDATGNGAQLAEAARQRYGIARVEEVKFSTEWYRINMPPYKAAFEDAALVLPRDALILEDHEQLVMEKGVVTLRKVRTGRTGLQRHGDSAIAGALSHFASRQPVGEYAYEAASSVKAPAGSLRSNEDDDRGGTFGPGAW
jgi:phage FluMu gp28-like protein